MSDLVLVPREELSELLEALGTVARIAPLLEERLQRPFGTLSSRSVDPTIGIWRILEEERQPRGLSEQESSRLFSFRIVEDGPPETPDSCLDLVEGAFTGCIGSRPGDCVRLTDRAFSAGFWAWAAVACNVSYSRAAPLGRASAIYIVLRALNCPSPRRVTTSEDLIRLISGDGAPIFEEFGSQVELEVFCCSARIPVPPLVRWINPQ